MSNAALKAILPDLPITEIPGAAWRSPVVTALPPGSIPAMFRRRHDTSDVGRIAIHAKAAVCPTLGLGAALTVAPRLFQAWLAPRFNLPL